MSPEQRWQLRTRELSFLHGPAIMGIVNVTPDSFSDGGRYFSVELAVEHGLKLAAEGAHILDIGGESTRPYSQSVSQQEEIDRVIPVIVALAEQVQIPISVDTSKACVAREAIAAGAEIVNDVTGLQGDPDMQSVVAESNVGLCVMHMQGTPQTMQDSPHYENVVEEIYDYLQQRDQQLVQFGIDPKRICLDPGLGFGKTTAHNLELLSKADRFLELGRPILIGHSRKGFVGKIIGDARRDRDAGTLGISLALVSKGIQVLRVHDVASTIDALSGFKACIAETSGIT
jgi:dihydropteroate synthase